jgi:hypothetical protein
LHDAGEANNQLDRELIVQPDRKRGCYGINVVQEAPSRIWSTIYAQLLQGPGGDAHRADGTRG